MTRTIDDIDVVFIDCQATAATPGKGWIFELAWQVGFNGTPHCTLVTLPDGEKIPRRVTQLTGVKTADLRDGVPIDAAIAQLRSVLEPLDAPVLVAHWARYERTWFEHFVDQPQRWICTHEVARRLLPGLPRKGLRAVAGYLGAPLDQGKRADAHVDATVFVWRELAGLLGEEGVQTMDALDSFLQAPVPKSSERLYPLAREKRLALPREPGVYRMLDRKGRVLYVGKATSLKDRVNSYFRQRRLANDKMELVTQVWDLDVTITESALEAALLEADEIKRLSPPYNHALQAEGREVVWCDPGDFRAMRPERRSHQWLGPFSSRRTCEQFAEVCEFVNRGGPLRWFAKASEDVAQSARNTFRAKHDVDELSVAGLLRLGEALFPLEDEDDPQEASRDVTPAEIVRYLEWSAVAAHRAATRGLWLRRLSVSTLRWAPHGAPDTMRELELGGDGSFPNIERYDRVSVALAEVKRILRDGRDVAIVDDVGDEWTGARLADELRRF